MIPGAERPMTAIAFLLLASSGCIANFGESLQVTVQPASVVQKHGGLVTLRCVVEPLRVNVTWRLNGRELFHSDDVLGIHIDQRLLTIAALNNHTVGQYQCMARVPEGVVASVPTMVTLANLKDFKYDGQHVIEVDEGNTAVIACDLPESHPKAQVRYSVKQEWLEASRDNYLIMPSGNLQIVNASQDDEGTYKCAAYNPVTQEIKTSVSSERLRVRRSTAEAARIIYPPEAQTIIVTKGQTLILECVASGIPPPRVTWAKDGSSVSSYNKTRFLLSNLLIDTITEEDSGTYSCMADNGVGEAAAAFVLYNVQVFEPPEVSMELSQQIITWGQSAKFTCKVRGNPQPTVVWLRNAVPLFSSHRIQLSRKVLWVSSVGPEDEGIYQCMAENEVGSAQAMVQLRTARPETTTLKPQQGSAGDSAQSAMSPARLSSSEKMLKDKVVLLRPKPTTPAASVQCTTKELVSLAEAPVILSSPRTTKTDSYELLWRPRHGGRVPILYYVIKHRKVMNSSDNWIVQDVPANQHHLTLTKLDPGSLYEVEMAAYNCAGEGQTAMVTFRTGRRPKPDIVASKEHQIQKDDPGTNSRNSNQSDNTRLSPPEAPDRPTISMASETSVYVTWIPRGNGGFPIQSFRVEYKKLKKPGDWVLATRDIPPSRLSVEITGLEKGTSYKFRVQALNILGESEPSAASRPYVVSGYSNRAYERPVAGPYITFTDAINETTIMLKWMYIPASNNNTPIHGFYIYYRPTDSDNDSDYKKDVVEGDRYWHSISHLQPETSYDIKMQCFNEGGESEFSNVMICETKARKSAGPAGRLPPSTVSTVQHPPLSSGHNVLGAGAMMARSSDLPYLIVGGVLGSIVLIIVAFIPFCLWRAWSKQKQTIDLGFPGAGLLVSSCQYTMVPLRGVSASQANGLRYANGVHLPAHHGANGHFPSATISYSSAKPHDYGPEEVHQQNEANAFLQGKALQNGNIPAEHQRSPSPVLDHSSYLYGLPDDSTHQLLQQHEDHHHHHHEQRLGLCHSVPQSKKGNSVMEDMKNTVFHTDSTCCLGLVPVEDVERTDFCHSRRPMWHPNPVDACLRESPEKPSSLPLNVALDILPSTS
ncbi:brother of CDO isoform X1 [Varanus komodoensis]|uniref:Brother of CDO n=1 Tax=Varanus komodoensis TaxID=61221 RepID=A0A8D2LT16_VARKO|nr:brother of CDO isoform X1 [Varanus komodoensis]XP_044297584.1 brother of CDO isoform X1 [Varanus komodoensis]XP_044297585.1 brother of CDO isoform X1 [Varanus komodoensis]